MKVLALIDFLLSLPFIVFGYVISFVYHNTKFGMNTHINVSNHFNNLLIDSVDKLVKRIRTK